MPDNQLQFLTGEELTPAQKQSVHDSFAWLIERGFVLDAQWVNRHRFYCVGDRFIGVYGDESENL